MSKPDPDWYEPPVLVWFEDVWREIAMFVRGYRAVLDPEVVRVAKRRKSKKPGSGGGKFTPFKKGNKMGSKRKRKPKGRPY